jgi:uncharacterized protein YegP (UPF0339 family)
VYLKFTIQRSKTGQYRIYISQRSIVKLTKSGQYRIYISKISMVKLIKVVLLHIASSML